MEKVVIFGAGEIGKRCFYNPCRRFEIVAVIDNDSSKIGLLFENKVPIISIGEYVEKYRECSIVITTANSEDVEMQLNNMGIGNYRIGADLYNSLEVPMDMEISHDNWHFYLQKKFNKKGIDILEIGSRNVTGTNLRNMFTKANYIGFDYYQGENVDVVGDAHKLSQYFDKKFDLIFSSAVFEHLAMPWKVSVEITRLLKLHGCVFIETHYSYSSHERPWHFFQFSENALDVLFPEKFGMRCLKKGCCNLMEGRFSEYASEYLVGRKVNGLYCHSEYLGEKVVEVEELSWDNIGLVDVAKSTEYPKPVK